MTGDLRMLERSSVAETIAPAPGPRARESFSGGPDNAAPKPAESEVQQSGSGDSSLAPEPPNPERFATIKARLHRRGPHPVLEPSL